MSGFVDWIKQNLGGGGDAQDAQPQSLSGQYLLNAIAMWLQRAQVTG